MPDPHDLEIALRLLPVPNAVALDSFLELGYLSSQYTVQDTRRSLPWRGDWIISALTNQTHIPTIASEFGLHIAHMFFKTRVREWVALCSGYKNDFLDKMAEVRDRIVDWAGYDTAKLESVLQALPSQQPLARWILLTAVSKDPLPDATTSLLFITDTIKQLLAEHRHNLPVLLQYLLIMESRFNIRAVLSADLDWFAPFSMDFSLWQCTCNSTPQQLANSITTFVQKLFSGVSYRRIDRTRLESIRQDWGHLVRGILVCLSVKPSLLNYVKELANVRRNPF